MAEEQNSVWPLPKFYFSVQLGSNKASFQEVSGLESETKIIEYRTGDNKQLAPIKMPGLARVGNVTLKKGIFAKDTKFFDWYSQNPSEKFKRETVVINLLNEKGDPAITWTLQNAWPTKITGTDLKSEGNEVAVESMELAFEVLMVKAA